MRAAASDALGSTVAAAVKATALNPPAAEVVGNF